MKNQTYWSNRQKQLNSQLEKDEEKLRQKLSAEYDKQSKRLEKEIAAYYQQYGANDVIEYRTLLLSLSDADRQLLMERMDEFAQKYPQYAHLTPVRESIYKLDRLEGLQTSIRMQQLEIGAIDNIQLEQHLSEYAAKSANVAAEQLGFGKNFYNINSDVVKTTINKKWINDKNFSERIWDNRKKLADYLCNDFASAVVRGDSYQKCINALKGRFNNVSRNDMFRLIYTEDTYVTNEASAQTFEEYYEQYQFHTVDGNACKTCKGINKKIFYFKDRKPGLNFPPLHTWCRCYYTVEVEDWDKWMDDYVDKKQAESIAKLAESDIIKSLDVDDFNLMATANEILPEVSNVIIDTITSYEDFKSFYLYDAIYEVVNQKSLFETDLNNYGLPVLRINKSKLAGKTLTEVDEMIKNTSVNLPNSLKEAVVHEIGHGKAYHGKSAQQVANMNNFIKSKGVKNISAIAEADGAECVAEVEVLLYRDVHIPPKAKLLYNLCVQPGKVHLSNEKFYGKGMNKR